MVRFVSGLVAGVVCSVLALNALERHTRAPGFAVPTPHKVVRMPPAVHPGDRAGQDRGVGAVESLCGSAILPMADFLVMCR